ncbi:unnamed protein product [Brugia timori]|uniref:Ovule protein n=1 Tax=Brugia timori TaxID=42155 RepID=A0A0R3Q715_9BILA|nr:unnamed protein product [Brugia timori]
MHMNSLAPFKQTKSLLSTIISTSVYLFFSNVRKIFLAVHFLSNLKTRTRRATWNSRQQLNSASSVTLMNLAFVSLLLQYNFTK